MKTLRSCLTLLLCATALAAQAQTYPSSPIKMISPFPPGGGTDLITRVLANKLSEANKWNIVVENKPGANGVIGLNDTIKEKADGYTLVVGQKDNMIVAPWLTKVHFDTLQDFSPIALLGTTSLVILTGADSRFKNFGDVARAAKAKPDEISFGTSGAGSLSHLTSELLRSRAGIALRHVPYRGTSPAMTDLMGGHLDLAGGSIASALPLINSGKLRPLAVTGLQRSSNLPDVPTLLELGMKNTDVTGWWGLLGPAGMPASAVARLHDAVNQVLEQPDVKQKLLDQGVEVASDSTEGFAALIKKDYADWKAIIAETGVRLN
ncbi:Bug family tripartite tricarboxylate transporter substrate binding protein [Pollutimonas bauzanensis]|uniref:Tripartite-type tricarboxylate transporter, receptor component TctC n=1 Tax=Pollutimonas bauzanensis TaxID=658167 RepID=A0A1M5Y802_9BURK|nr:tripartite tricarboxylate transporter substrate binding protein [Pollutimonas bauzanensis]SHI08211.1 Tripartite-type tricarboxylate transporter, receptor component TctC [Pollutimonas bauzanensis]